MTHNDHITRMNYEQNVRDGLVAKAPPRRPTPDELSRLKGCDSMVTNAFGVFLIVVGLVAIVIGAV